MNNLKKEMYDQIIKRGKIIKELKEKNKYDNSIIDFYNTGILVIKDIDILITNINILQDDNNNQIFDIVDDRFNLPKDFKIKRIINFRDSSLFKKLIDKYKDKIINNKIIISNEILNDLVGEKWDGTYHTLVPEAAYLDIISKEKEQRNE